MTFLQCVLWCSICLYCLSLGVGGGFLWIGDERKGRVENGE